MFYRRENVRFVNDRIFNLEELSLSIDHLKLFQIQGWKWFAFKQKYLLTDTSLIVGLDDLDGSSITPSISSLFTFSMPETRGRGVFWVPFGKPDSWKDMDGKIRLGIHHQNTILWKNFVERTLDNKFCFLFYFFANVFLFYFRCSGNKIKMGLGE